jgi:hypothetical protein
VDWPPIESPVFSHDSFDQFHGHQERVRRFLIATRGLQQLFAVHHQLLKVSLRFQVLLHEDTPTHCAV